MYALHAVDGDGLADVVAGAAKVGEVGQRENGTRSGGIANFGDKGIMNVDPGPDKLGLKRSNAGGRGPVAGERLTRDIGVACGIHRDARASVVDGAAEIRGIDQSHGAGAVGVDFGYEGVGGGGVEIARGDGRCSIQATLLCVLNREVGFAGIFGGQGRIENKVGGTGEVHVAAVIDGNASAGDLRGGRVCASKKG